MFIKNYWDDKDKRAEKAVKHTYEMNRIHYDNIMQSVKHTSVYDTDFALCDQVSESFAPMKIFVEDSDTVTAGMRHCHNDEKMAILNFASYKNPGGKFMQGSCAQEECLCHASYLYNVLTEFDNTYYRWNRQHLNKALYLNRGLYTPDMIFYHSVGSYLSDVITCAAPNKRTAQKWNNVTEQENLKELQSRIKFVLDMAQAHRVDTLILGAFGCGVFGQDPNDVATIFKELLLSSKYSFKNVIFAIPKGRDSNYKVFNTVILSGS